MRKYIILDMPINDIKKVMIVDVKDEVNMFLYNTSDDVPSIGDYSFETLQEAEDFFTRNFQKKKIVNLRGFTYLIQLRIVRKILLNQ
ncbi:hypothetical protein MUB16_35960 [Priestia sp. OVL9]|nr:hypothetical protein [Priestia sp. OVL9]